MDFTLSPTLEQTRAEFKKWLRANLPDREQWKRLHDHGPLAARIAFLKDWQRRLYDGRWIAVHWPSEYGGRGASLRGHLVAHEELVRAEAPPRVAGQHGPPVARDHR